MLFRKYKIEINNDKFILSNINMPKQSKLEHFFQISSNSSQINKKCFIYDPQNRVASFQTNALPTDQFLNTKCGIRLYYRVPTNKPAMIIPRIQTSHGLPILKSNLQKAVRRGHTKIAINSALAIIQKDPVECLRRLPIICIEDVCLIDSFAIPVWLMMADKEHSIDQLDIDLLLNIVYHLCECRSFYDDRMNYTQSYELTHKHLQEYPHKDVLLSIFYRIQYGGMKGDMRMLNNALYYYCEHPEAIETTKYDNIQYVDFDATLEILPEAIDYHPFSCMLTMIAKDTTDDTQDIKTHIWFVESGLNIRKSYTLDMSREYAEHALWKRICSKLKRVRAYLIQQPN